jgi:hypothetical protein
MERKSQMITKLHDRSSVLNLMAPMTNSSVISSATAAPGSRSRPQARKKPSDDAAYFGPTGGGNGVVAGAKRHGGDRIEGEPRIKRKRMDGVGINGVGRRDGGEGMDVKGSLVIIFFFREYYSANGQQVKFTNMPTSVLYRYLSYFDLVPAVHPSPLTAEDPPPPLSLETETRHHSPTPSVLQATTPANRPRRELKEQSRRRSSRLAEVRGRTPVLADVDEVHRVLAGIAEKHFKEEVRREEVDVLACFMCKLKAKW